MSYSIDANLLLYAANMDAGEHALAIRFLRDRAKDPDLLCMTWPALFAFQRIATHPAIFRAPLSPKQAWENILKLLALPRCQVIPEQDGFAEVYSAATAGLHVRGNLVPDAHIATILLQHGVRRIYTADSDFRKFNFLEVINPLDEGKLRQK